MSVSRPENGKYTPSDLDPSLCTHVVYAFAVLDKEGLVIKPHDIWLDVENSTSQFLIYGSIRLFQEKRITVFTCIICK